MAGTAKSRSQLEALFAAADTPSAQDFADVFASFVLTTEIGITENETLKSWAAHIDDYIVAATLDSDDVISTGTIAWPDGSAGTFTRTAKNATWLAVDAYTATHTDSGKTVTQTAVTRDGDGNVTERPELTVA